MTTEERIQEVERIIVSHSNSITANKLANSVLFKEAAKMIVQSEAARNKENAVALIRWMIRNTITEGVDESKAENLYNNYLFQSGIIEQNKKV